ncbi:hypothetical protein [Pseudomonas moorei]|uniref:hypothetical protein n=1 Tax=Pseudomonas moorei TaxID=395599 RepID=UPI00200F57CE|nr:hypothetical protein [Pseudomonas moorei]
MTNNIYLEVNKSNGAILCYYLEQPTTASDKVDYILATKDELTYLSALEDCIFGPGMVATLSDLQAHRARVQAAKKAKAARPTKPVTAAPQQPTKAASKASTDPMVITNFKNGFKPVRK